jgi:hypothetical protein
MVSPWPFGIRLKSQDEVGCVSQELSSYFIFQNIYKAEVIHVSDVTNGSLVLIFDTDVEKWNMSPL